MNRETACILNKVTQAFYRLEASSFSDTRKSSWPGWERCIQLIDESARKSASSCGSSPRATMHLLDLACGNLRFEAALSDSLPHIDIRVRALDACDELASLRPLGADRDSVRVAFRSFDAVSAALSDEAFPEELVGPPCDIAVSFGFLHHVPGQRARKRIMRFLLDAVRPGGVVMVTFWRFLREEGLATRALRAQARACEELACGTVAGLEGLRVSPSSLDLDPGDFLLGWKHEAGAYRYCHSFSDEDIDDIAATLAGGACEVARFDADGRTGDLNTYLVLRKTTA